MLVYSDMRKYSFKIEITKSRKSYKRRQNGIFVLHALVDCDKATLFKCDTDSISMHCPKTVRIKLFVTTGKAQVFKQRRHLNIEYLYWLLSVTLQEKKHFIIHQGNHRTFQIWRFYSLHRVLSNDDLLMKRRNVITYYFAFMWGEAD